MQYNNDEKEALDGVVASNEKELLDNNNDLNQEAKEVDLQSENNENAQTIRPKRKNYTTIAATAIVGVVGLGVIASSGLINLNMDGSINEISYVDNKLVYDIDVNDVNKDNSIYFEIYDNGKSVMKYDVISKENFDGNRKGEFPLDELDILSKDLTLGLKYTVRLKGDTGLIDRTYDSWVLEIEGVSSEFNGALLTCDCAVSGYLLIDIDFKDDYGVYSDFEATLVDSSNVSRECVFSDNLHETQKIFVLDLAGGEATFTLRYKENGVLKTSVSNINI